MQRDSAAQDRMGNMALGYTHTNDPTVLGELVPLYFESVRRVWD